MLERQAELADKVEQRTGTRPRTVFFQHDGRPIRTYRAAFIAAARAAGCPEIRPHDLRRTAVRNLERAGVPRSSAMEMVGHETEAIYGRYSIVDEAMLREAGAKMDKRRRR